MLRLVTYLLVAASLVFASLLFQDRNVIAADLWHWRNGDSVQLDGYVVPVPSGWRVTSQEQDYLVLVDDAGNRSTISVRPDRSEQKDKKVSRGLKKSIVSQQGVSKEMGSELPVCDDGPSQKVLKVPLSHTVTYSCISDGRLNIVLTGHDSKIQQMLSLINRLQPQATPPSGTKPQ